jgi:hypothetical protein
VPSGTLLLGNIALQQPPLLTDKFVAKGRKECGPYAVRHLHAGSIETCDLLKRLRSLGSAPNPAPFSLRGKIDHHPGRGWASNPGTRPRTRPAWPGLVCLFTHHGLIRGISLALFFLPKYFSIQSETRPITQSSFCFVSFPFAALFPSQLLLRQGTYQPRARSQALATPPTLRPDTCRIQRCLLILTAGFAQHRTKLQLVLHNKQ